MDLKIEPVSLSANQRPKHGSQGQGRKSSLRMQDVNPAGPYQDVPYDR